MTWLYLTIILIIIIELGLIFIVRLARRDFPWLITEQDDIPTLDEDALKKFIDYSFDPYLGWVRKPNSHGVEQGQKGEIKFQIDSTGSRANKFKKLPPVMAAFGDSYVFCRQVENDETWEAQLSVSNSFGVLNYGVGNYGVDQALLRYERMTLPSTVRVVIIGLVPESICRIQSYWKHYLEFGNTFAFKPRFVLESDGQLSLLENPMRNAKDFAHFQNMLSNIQARDGFYKNKFRSLQFRVPYLFSLMRNPIRQFKLINAVILRMLLRPMGMSTSWCENLPFALVMKDNIRSVHKLYRDKESTELLSAILLRFNNVALSRGHIPLVVVMPQLLDLKLIKNKNSPYKNFFQQINSLLPVLDLTEKFSNKEKEINRLYINDQYGGHLSPTGNLLVAEEISAWLTNSKLKL